MLFETARILQHHRQLAMLEVPPLLEFFEIEVIEVSVFGPKNANTGTRRCVKPFDVSGAMKNRDRGMKFLIHAGRDLAPHISDKDGLPWPVHGVLYSYGVALMDNALLEPLAQVCAEERRYDFMFMALPLLIFFARTPGALPQAGMAAGF